MKTILITFCVFAASVSYSGNWNMTCSNEVVKIDTIIPTNHDLLMPVAEPDQSDEPLSFAEKMPEYPGGEKAMSDFIAANIKYPKYEMENNIQGTVYVQFVVEKDASVTAVKTLRGVQGSKNFSPEAERVVKLLKFSKPAYQNGKPVRIYMALPIKFHLPKNTEGEKNSSEDMPPPPPMPEPVKSPKTNQSERLEEPVAFAAEMPEYPGGEKAMVEFISANVKYPKYEKDNNIQGVVYVQFVIEKDASVSEVKTTRDVKGAKNLSQEAERVVKLLKFSKPAYQNGKPVRLTMTMPVRFSLNKEEATPKKP